MKKITADLTTAEIHQVVKQTAQSRRRFIYRDKQRQSGDQRFRPVGNRNDEPELDDDLAGIDLRRVTKLSDLGTP